MDIRINTWNMHTPDDPTSTAKRRQTCTHSGTISATQTCKAAVQWPWKHFMIANQIQIHRRSIQFNTSCGIEPITYSHYGSVALRDVLSYWSIVLAEILYKNKTKKRVPVTIQSQRVTKSKARLDWANTAIRQGLRGDKAFAWYAGGGS